MKKFVLKLVLANDAMQTTDDICTALETTIQKVRRFGVENIHNRKKHIRDINGNVIGRFQTVDKEEITEGSADCPNHSFCKANFTPNCWNTKCPDHDEQKEAQ